MRRSGLLLSLALGSGLVACSSDSKTEESAPADTGADDSGEVDTGTSDTGSTDTGTPNAMVESQALLDFCTGFVDSMCSHLYDCSAEFADMRAEWEAGYGFHDKESCKLSIAPEVDWNCRPEVNAVAGGRMRLDAERFDRCVAFLAVDDCATSFANTPEELLCIGLYPVVPIVADGGSCARTSECANALSRCSFLDRFSTAANGVCEPALGASCNDAGTCLPTQYCDQPGNDWEVDPGIEGACAPKATLGADCEDHQQCEEGSLCTSSEGLGQNNEPINGTCQ